MNKYNIFDSISTLKGVGPQLSKYLKKKKIEKIKDFDETLQIKEIICRFQSQNINCSSAPTT